MGAGNKPKGSSTKDGTDPGNTSSLHILVDVLLNSFDTSE
jgi:hypothetical protein